MLRLLLERPNCEERYNNFLFIYIFPTGTCDMILLEIKKSFKSILYFSQLIRQFLLLVHVKEKNIQLWTVNGQRKIKKWRSVVLYSAKFKRIASLNLNSSPLFSPCFSLIIWLELGSGRWEKGVYLALIEIIEGKKGFPSLLFHQVDGKKGLWNSVFDKLF